MNRTLILLAALGLVVAGGCQRKSQNDPAETSGGRAPGSGTTYTEPPGELWALKRDATLVKRQTDMKLLERGRNEQNTEFIDTRYERGLMIDLDAGTRVRKLGGGKLYKNPETGVERAYYKVVVESGQHAGEMGLVAGEALRRVQ